MNLSGSSTLLTGNYEKKHFYDVRNIPSRVRSNVVRLRVNHVIFRVCPSKLLVANDGSFS